MRIELALAAAMTFSAWTALAEAGDQDCTPDKNGALVCPQADASCLREQDGGVVCSKPGGGIELDRLGKASCGPGYCTTNQDGEIWCSSVARGAASTDSYGKAACTTSCVRAKPQLCVKPKPSQ
jgi:hypothetical protein